MGLKPKYTKVDKYLLQEAFVESLQELDIRTALKIARYIDRNVEEIPVNEFTSTILGGIIPQTHAEPIIFAVEIVQTKKSKAILSDVKLISIDEYLDLYNLNLIITDDENRKSKGGKKNS
jgi:hypothetical protein